MDCPLCKSRRQRHILVRTQERKGSLVPAEACLDCGLIFLDDYMQDRSGLYSEEYSIWSRSEEADERIVAESKHAAFAIQLRYLARFTRPAGKKLLDIGTGKAYLLDMAKQMGFDCYGLELSSYAAKKASERYPGRIFNGTLDKAKYSDRFDVITMTDLIEHIPEPMPFWESVARALKKGGLVFITTPNTDSLTRKLLGRSWFQYKYEHVIYWNRTSLKYALDKAGFELLLFRNNDKRFNLEHYHKYFKKYSIFGLEKVFNLAYMALPSFMKKAQFTNPFVGEFLAIARKK